MNCPCHDVPMYWHKKKDMRAGGLWRCRVRKREVGRKQWANYYYDRMPAHVRIPRELRSRRRHALNRRRERQLQEG